VRSLPAAFLQPRSVAIVGASDQRGNPRNTLVRNLLKHGFDGRVHPVSTSRDEIEGLPAVGSVGDLPEQVDLALVITPAATVPGVVADCGRRDIKNAIVFSAGFEEVEGGDEIARQLKAAAEDHGVTVVGPNCNGVWSVRHKAILTFSPAALNLDRVHHAPIAIVSQSGALAGAMTNSLQRNGSGVSYVVSVGNETCLDALEVLSALVEQDDVRGVGLYVEGLDNAARLLPIAQRAREQGVQIVALKAGRSEVGLQATQSHTGKLASAHAVYSDIFRQAGAIEVTSLAELTGCLEAIATLPAPRRSDHEGSGVAVLSSSGGAGALLADHSSELDVPLATFSRSTQTRLEALLPGFARAANPIDLTGQINTDRDLFRRAAEAVVDDPRTEALVVQFASSGRRYLDENAETFTSLARHIPVVLSFVGETMEPEIRRGFLEAGVLLTADPLETMRALSHLYRSQREVPAGRGAAVPPAPRSAPRDWASSMQFVDDVGLSPAPWVLLEPGDVAATACAGLRYPLAVKVLPEASPHKSESKLLELDLHSPQAVDAAAALLRDRLGAPGEPILVQEMARRGVEVVLSCRRDADFGPVISIGTGGVAVELHGDIHHLALPVTAEQVVDALDRSTLWTLLQGFRGSRPADVDVLVAGTVRLGDLFLATPDLIEIELNPVIVAAEGHGLRTVDALVGVSDDTAVDGRR
jgi:acyl-CoA synthetase (NDP forming)